MSQLDQRSVDEWVLDGLQSDVELALSNTDFEAEEIIGIVVKNNRRVHEEDEEEVAQELKRRVSR